MFKKILLIENRPGRQVQYMPNGEKELFKLKNIQGFTMIGFEENLTKINDNNFDFLKEFSLVMIHRSALGELSKGSKITAVADYCKTNLIDLIYFSGGISSSFFTELNGIGFLLINSKDFYSDNFMPFLKEYIEGRIKKLIELKYGKSWKLNYLFQLRELNALKAAEEFGEDDYRIQDIEILLDLKNYENIDMIIKTEISKYE